MFIPLRTFRCAVSITLALLIAPRLANADVVVAVNDDAYPPNAHPVGLGSLGTGRFASDEAIVLTTAELATAAGTDDFGLIRIYDDNSLGGAPPVADVGPVAIIVAASTTTLPFELRLLVAPPSDNDFQDVNGQVDFRYRAPNQPMLFAGARAFTSLTFGSNSTIFTLEDLRERVRLAAYVTRNFGTPNATPPDRIEAGQVFRLQAIGPQPTDGNIIADIVGYAADGRWGLPTISHIEASNSIAGTIQAVGNLPEPIPGNTLFDGDYRSIGDVVVGARNPNAAGITGDLLAVEGHIGRLYSAGPIGDPLQDPRMQIHAGDGVEEIRCVYEEEDPEHPGSLLTVVADGDIVADITANGLTARPDFPYFTSSTGDLTFAPGEDAAIWSIRTNGDLEGSINVGNLAYGGLFSEWHGIFVRGAINAPINVEFNMQFTNIVAGALPEPITIGRAAKGAIVAVGSDSFAGRIEEVSVGFGQLTPEQVAAFGDYTPGLTGVIGGHRNAASSDDWFDSDATSHELGALDGGIFARDSIGTIAVNMMTQRFVSSDTKPNPPRVEAPSVDQLTISDMREGVVWSGHLEFEGDQVADNPSNDYAAIQQFAVNGCVGPSADLWIDCPRAEISGNLYGEVHLRDLDADEAVIIGGTLAMWPCTVTGANACDEYEFVPVDSLHCGDSNYAFSLFSEESPRDTTWGDEETRQKGAVRILEPNGLAGQIIINANGDPMLAPGEGWDGWVIIGDHLPSQSPPVGQRILRPGVAQPNLAPYYEATSADLGGGAVGLVPFQMHAFDSAPSYTPADAPGHEFVGTDWDDPAPFIAGHNAIFIRHYGPIWPDFLGSGLPYVTLSLAVGQGEHDFTELYTIATSLEDSALDDRTIRITYGAIKGDGKWTVRPDPTLYCDSTFFASSGLVPVDDWEYKFVMLLDCNENGIPDSVELLETNPDPDLDDDGILDECEHPCNCDLVDPDDFVNIFDLLAYLDFWFAADPAAERDGVAGIDVFDLLNYLDCWFLYSGDSDGCPS